MATAIIASFAMVGQLSASPMGLASGAQPAPSGRTMTPEDVAAAQQEWATSRHADTYDHGQGGNSTCARCKSPRNWDPKAAATETAHDCASCKRLPGAPRPDLAGGVSVTRSDWHGITCDICHQPVGNSYSTGIVYWDQSLGVYEPVTSVMDLCARCHEGQHGFEVVAEQKASTVHAGWDCIQCHGPHGKPAKCVDCHDPAKGKGAVEHARHPDVDCTACHDAGGLDVWQDTNSQARHSGQYMTVRFAHALTSWPSHNLQVAVDCKRCHHPQGQDRPALTEKVGCSDPACHPEGAMLNWCPAFQRDPAPTIGPRQ
jgi:hypothetical protein